MPTTTGKATELITFTRGTLATVTDADGKIKWAPHNLLLASEQFDSASWTKNGVTPTANAAAAPNGTTTADRLVGSSSTKDVYQSVSLVAGVKYKIALWAKSFGGTNQTIAFFGDNTIVSANQTVTADWQLFEFEFTVATGGSRACGITQGSGAAAYDILVWGAHLYRSDLGGMQANPSVYPMYNPSTPKNLLGYSEDFSNAAWAKTRAGVTANSVAAPNGSLSADTLTATAASTTSHYLRQSVTMANSRCIFSVYAKAGTSSWIALQNDGVGGTLAFFNLTTGTVGSVGAGSIATITGVGDGWYRCAISQVAAAGSNAFDIFLASADNVVSFTAVGTETVYLWGAQLSDSASLDAYSPVFGAAPSAAAYHGPRLDYDPVTFSARGLLVEEARTNLLVQSNGFGTASWTKTSGITVTANATTAPDGTSTAAKLVETTDTTHVLYQSGGTTTGAVTISVYVKASERTFFRISSDDAGSKIVWFNLSTGAVGTVSAGMSNASITNVGNGWYRCATTITSKSSGGNIAFGPALSDGGNDVYAGTAGSGLFIWGAQLEAGSFATSYIPTAAATVTRNADVASVGTSQFPYSSTEGTLVVSASVFGLGASTASGLISLTGGSASENTGIYRGSSSNNIYGNMRDNNSDQALYTVALGSQPLKAAFAYAENNSNFALGGTAQTTDTTCTIPTVTEMLIGSVYAKGDYPTNGWIRQITYLPRRITNAELVSRTA